MRSRSRGWVCPALVAPCAAHLGFCSNDYERVWPSPSLPWASGGLSPSHWELYISSQGAQGQDLHWDPRMWLSCETTIPALRQMDHFPGEARGPQWEHRLLPVLSSLVYWGLTFSSELLRCWDLEAAHRCYT